MRAEIIRHALNRVPLSLIIDDSTVLVNLNYFWMRDRNPVDGVGRRWEDVPLAHPEWFTRSFAEWCLDNKVRGKFSVVPCPAGLGRVDEGLPMFSAEQQESWLAMCRDLITPAFDITPEMITHTFVVDPKTCRPRESRIWEQFDWQALPADEEEVLIDYIATACRILVNVGLTPQGVTSPGGFGGKSLPLYAKVAGQGIRQVTGNPTPYFFQQVFLDKPVPAPVWYADRTRGEATGEIIAVTDDWTGNWTGYGEVSVDKYISADLQGGRLPAVIDAGDPAVLVSHWQGFYGLHSDDQRGFNAFKTVVRRLKERDPEGASTRWRKCSEITTYAIARDMADLRVEGDTVTLNMPVQAPELTLRLNDIEPQTIRVDGVPLRRVERQAQFESGTYLVDGRYVLVAFDPQGQQAQLVVERVQV